MKMWKQTALAVGLVVLLIVGVFLAIFGVSGLSYVVTTGRAVQESSNWTVLYGLMLLIGLALVYIGLKKS